MSGAASLRTLAVGTVIVTVTLAWVLAGIGGAAYVAGLFAAVSVGWPLGIALFGRHPVGIITGSVVGYAATALALWIGLRAGAAPALFAAVAWGVIALAGWSAVRARSKTLITLPEWSVTDTRALAAALGLTAVLVVPPFARVGARDPDGTRLYRAYFTADFVWHMALTAELAKGDMPPRNPYLRGQRMHYYWMYFLPPAAAANLAPRLSIAGALKVTALFAALLFIGSLFGLVWTAVPRGGVVLAAVAFGLVSASLEGTYALIDLWNRGRPLSGVTDLNIDAMSAWRFGGLRIDGLTRAMWYNPQHSMALALALPALAAVSAAGARLGPTVALVLGICLGASMTLNPFVGVLIAATYGLAVTADALASRLSARRLLTHAVVVAPMILAFVWLIGNEVAEGAGQAIRFGIGGPAARRPLESISLSVGPLLVAAIPALVRLGGFTEFRLVPAALGCGIAATAMFAMRLSVDEFWVGFRTGQILQVLLIVLVAGGLARVQARWSVALLALLACAGAPTTLIDYWNAQDTGNRRMGPGFHWTITISPDQQAVLDWIRTKTPPTAIVQMDAIARGRETWSLIPSFAERRMAAGLAIPLLNTPEYRARSEQVREMYAAHDAETAWRLARRLGIDYVYADAIERAAYPGGIGKFDAAPSYFESAFRRGDAAVWRVLDLR